MRKTKKYDVLIAGYLGIDLIPEFKKKNSREHTNIYALLKPGTLTEIDGLQLSLGGVVANTGLAMKRFSRNVYLNGLTGNDFMGKIISEWLERYNLEGGIKMTTAASTAFGIVIAPPGIDRIFLESPGCNEIFDVDDIDLAGASDSRIFHFGYPPLLKKFFADNGRMLRELFSTVSQSGTVTSLDLSLPDPQGEAGKCDWPAIMRATLPFTDIFVPSVEELLLILMPAEYHRIYEMAGTDDIVDLISMSLVRELGQRIIALGVKILLIKMAHRGAYLVTGNVSALSDKGLVLDDSWNYTELHCEAYAPDPARLKNASGAGDTAVAAFLSAIIGEEHPARAVKYACIAGRNNLYCNDLYTELDGWEQMTAEIDAEDEEADPVSNLKAVSL